MDDINFCPACGKNLGPGTAYCPACGRSMGGPEGERRETAKAEKEAGGRVSTATVLLIVNAAVLFLFGLIMFVALGMAEDMIEMYPEMFSGYTAESMKELIRQMGVVLLAAGSVGAAAALLTYKRRLWAVAFILCIIAMAIGITTVICALIGVVALYYLYKAKPSFRD